LPSQTKSTEPAASDRQPQCPDESLGKHGEHEQQARNGQDEARDREVDEGVESAQLAVDDQVRSIDR